MKNKRMVFSVIFVFLCSLVYCGDLIITFTNGTVISYPLESIKNIVMNTENRVYTDGILGMYYEEFKNDIFDGLLWRKRRNSVFIEDGNLVINSGDGVDDYADLLKEFTLPIIIETRVKLVYGGQNYRTPWINLYYGDLDDERIDIGYLSNKTKEWGGWAFKGWTFSEVKAVPSENTWITIKIEVNSDFGQLMVKYDNEDYYTPVIKKNWSISRKIQKIRYSQPWDSKCIIDYIKVYKK